MRRLLAFTVIFVLAALSAPAQGTTYISNLGDAWPVMGIGDIHSLFPGGDPYGTDAAHFTTGAGYYSLNSVTLQFWYDVTGDPQGVAAPNWTSLQLFQTTGNLLLGSLGNPVADPRQTQWPRSANPASYTAFVDFSPSQQITLNPFSQYSIVVSVPANSPVGANLLFTESSAYTTAAGWTMGATIAGNPFASGENLVMAVQGTEIPEPNTAPLMTVGGFVLIGWKHIMRKRSQQEANV